MDIKSIKNDLLSLKDELEIRLNNTDKHIKHVDGPNDPDFAEQAVERQNDEVVFGLNESARIELMEIKKALSRIETGDYGICQKCGEPISEARLGAVPYTNLCIPCIDEVR